MWTISKTLANIRKEGVVYSVLQYFKLVLMATLQYAFYTTELFQNDWQTRAVPTLICCCFAAWHVPSQWTLAVPAWTLQQGASALRRPHGHFTLTLATHELVSLQHGAGWQITPHVWPHASWHTHATWHTHFDLHGAANTQQLRQQNFCSCGSSPVELSSSPAVQSQHHLWTVPMTAEGTPFSGSMNTALRDFWYGSAIEKHLGLLTYFHCQQGFFNKKNQGQLSVPFLYCCSGLTSVSRLICSLAQSETITICVVWEAACCMEVRPGL